MCGIVGYVGRKNAAGELYEGLTRLEYRGYDSAGICVNFGGQLKLFKHSGRVSTLLCDLPLLNGNVGIGHTRWATHGEPSDKNAHPFVAGKFAVAHNGIIENYAAIKEELISNGAIFTSDTDSEVVVHLLNFYYRGNLLDAVYMAVKRLKGSFSLAILCSDYEEICAVKHNSPAIVGYGDGEFYLASDITALGGKCQTCAILQDDDVAILSRDGIKIYDCNLQLVERNKLLTGGGVEFDLGDCPHYMLKEIREDGQAIKNTCEAFFNLDCIDYVKESILNASGVYLLGCGTAFNSGLAASYIWDSLLPKKCRVEIASELRYFPPKVDCNTVVFAISQSGETADTIEAASLLKSLGAKIFAITNAPRSAITRIANCVLPICAGNEICVAATKSYCGQLACLYLVGSAIKGNLAECKQNLFDCAKKQDLVIYGECGIKELAKLCVNSKAVFFLGREQDYAVAVEGSLKLKEVSYIFSDAYPAGELKHGTLALIDEHTLSIIIITKSNIAEKSLNAVEEILSRKGNVAVITTLSWVADTLKKRIKNVIFLTNCNQDYSPFITSSALQLLAYFSAVELGRNPDKPRNLAKSVTVE